eukprot:tig00021348_g20532.t1
MRIMYQPMLPNIFVASNSGAGVRSLLRRFGELVKGNERLMRLASDGLNLKFKIDTRGPYADTPAFRALLVKAQACILVADTSQEGAVAAAKAALGAVGGNGRFKGKPMLIMANKRDVDGCLPLADLEAAAGAQGVLASTKLVEACGAPGEAKFNAAMSAGLEWLLASVIDGAERLARKQARDAAIDARLAKLAGLEGKPPPPAVPGAGVGAPSDPGKAAEEHRAAIAARVAKLSARVERDIDADRSTPSELAAVDKWPLPLARRPGDGAGGLAGGPLETKPGSAGGAAGPLGRSASVKRRSESPAQQPGVERIDMKLVHTDPTYRFGYLSKFMGFMPEDVATIKGSAPVLGPLVPGLVDAVYAKLFSFHVTKRYFMPQQDGYTGELPGSEGALTTSHAIIKFRKEKLAKYLVKLVTSEYDGSLVEYVDFVGKVHTKKAGNKSLEIDLVHMNALFGYVNDALIATFQGLSGGVDQATKDKLVRAFTKLLWVQSDFTSRHYTNCDSVDTGGLSEPPPAPLPSTSKAASVPEIGVEMIDMRQVHTNAAYRFGYLSKFMVFGPEDVAAIKGSAPVLGPLVPGLVDAVYAKLFSFDVTKRYFMPQQDGYTGSLPQNEAKFTVSHEVIKFRKEKLAKYLVKLVTSEYDGSLVEYVDFVGKVHTKKAGNKDLEVDLVHMNALFGYVNDALIATFQGLTNVDQASKDKLIRAFTKLLWIQSDFTSRHYTVCDAAESAPAALPAPAPTAAPAEPGIEKIDMKLVHTNAGYRFGYLGKFMEFGAGDIAAIKGSAPVLGPLVPGLVDAVYAKLFSFDVTKRYFMPQQDGYTGELPGSEGALTTSHAIIKFRKEKLAKYLVKLVTSEYDGSLVEYVDFVGKVHTKKAGNKSLEIDLVHMNALFGYVNDALIATFQGLSGGVDQATKDKLVRAFTKLLWVQSDFTSRHYTNCDSVDTGEAPITTPMPAAAASGPAEAGVEVIDMKNVHTSSAYRFGYLARFMGFSADDIATVKGIAPVLGPLVPTLVDAVYAKLFSFDVTKKYFMPQQEGYSGSLPQSESGLSVSHEIIQYRKEKLTKYLVKLVTAEYDAALVEYVDYVGRIHTKKDGNKNLEIDLVHMNALFGYVNDALIATFQCLPVDQARKDKLVRAFTKLLWIQSDFVSRHYTVCDAAESVPAAASSAAPSMPNLGAGLEVARLKEQLAAAQAEAKRAQEETASLRAELARAKAPASPKAGGPGLAEDIQARMSARRRSSVGGLGGEDVARLADEVAQAKSLAAATQARLDEMLEEARARAAAAAVETADARAEAVSCARLADSEAARAKEAEARAAAAAEEAAQARERAAAELAAAREASAAELSAARQEAAKSASLAEAAEAKASRAAADADAARAEAAAARSEAAAARADAAEAREAAAAGSASAEQAAAAEAAAAARAAAAKEVEAARAAAEERAERARADSEAARAEANAARAEAAAAKEAARLAEEARLRLEAELKEARQASGGGGGGESSDAKQAAEALRVALQEASEARAAVEQELRAAQAVAAQAGAALAGEAATARARLEAELAAAREEAEAERERAAAALAAAEAEAREARAAGEREAAGLRAALAAAQREAAAAREEAARDVQRATAASGSTAAAVAELTGALGKAREEAARAGVRAAAAEAQAEAAKKELAESQARSRETVERLERELAAARAARASAAAADAAALESRLAAERERERAASAAQIAVLESRRRELEDRLKIVSARPSDASTPAAARGLEERLQAREREHAAVEAVAELGAWLEGLAADARERRLAVLRALDEGAPGRPRAEAELRALLEALEAGVAPRTKAADEKRATMRRQLAEAERQLAEEREARRRERAHAEEHARRVEEKWLARLRAADEAVSRARAEAEAAVAAGAGAQERMREAVTAAERAAAGRRGAEEAHLSLLLGVAAEEAEALELQRAAAAAARQLRADLRGWARAYAEAARAGGAGPDHNVIAAHASARLVRLREAEAREAGYAARVRALRDRLAASAAAAAAALRLRAAADAEAARLEGYRVERARLEADVQRLRHAAMAAASEWRAAGFGGGGKKRGHYRPAAAAPEPLLATAPSSLYASASAPLLAPAPAPAPGLGSSPSAPALPHLPARALPPIIGSPHSPEPDAAAGAGAWAVHTKGGAGPHALGHAHALPPRALAAGTVSPLRGGKSRSPSPPPLAAAPAGHVAAR